MKSKKTTMTDRAATNTNFNVMLQNYRENILQTTVECWNEMADEATQ